MSAGSTQASGSHDDHRRYDSDGGGDSDRGRRDQDGDDGENGEGHGRGDGPAGLLHRPFVLIIGAAVLLVAIVVGVLVWLHARRFESTDDAFVDTHIIRLAPQISGEVSQVLVDDNQLVQAGQPLVLIDSADVQTRVAQAQAQQAQAQSEVAQASAQVAANRAGYQQARADVDAAAAQADDAARNLARYAALQRANAQAVAQQQLDQAQDQARQTAAQRLSAARAAAGRSDQVRASQSQVAAGQDQVRAAQAQLDQADINLGYARLIAPVAGHIAQKTVAAGNYVQPGTQLLAIVPLDIWVTANFKETQLARIRIGQRVDIRIDACAGQKIDGHVDSIQRGAGQAFGVLPPENATGNYVKVVQRVPVKIVFDHLPRTCPLGPGMSVEPSVVVR